MPGQHEEPIGVQMGRSVYRIDQNGVAVKRVSARQVEGVAIAFLNQLAWRLAGNAKPMNRLKTVVSQ